MNPKKYFYPEKMGRIILLGMEEVLGVNGKNAVLRLQNLSHFIDNPPPTRNDRTFPFETVSAIQEAFELTYGPSGGRGVALRVGRATFKSGLREYGSMLGLTGIAFRLLPLPTKLHTGAVAFAELFNKHTDQKVRLEERRDKIYWHIERCPLCWKRNTSEVACHLAVGLLQESLYWVSGGKSFKVEEIACIARGDPSCAIEIDPLPL
ncbi:MAG: 4-vinyl reductase [Chloroflexi bacterium]|nr:4-vinyl reductase [Chloroflexota bacterium]